MSRTVGTAYLLVAPFIPEPSTVSVHFSPMHYLQIRFLCNLLDFCWNGMAKIFKGESPFDDGRTLEVIDGLPEGADIPVFPDVPQEFSPGLDTELKKLAHQLQVTRK